MSAGAAGGLHLGDAIHFLLNVRAEIEGVAQTVAGRVKNLEERYAEPLPRPAARDLLHAAVMLRVEGSPSTIITADGAFDDLAPEGIERLDPADIEEWRGGIEGDRA